MPAPEERIPPASDDEASLWQRLRQESDTSARSTLIQHYLGFARSIAASLYAERMYPDMEFGDYVQYARIGLIEAIDRYDPGRGALFTSFATYRVRGSILNGLVRASENTEQLAHRRRVRQRERVDSLQVEDKTDTKDDLFAEMVETALALALGYVLEDSGLWKTTSEDVASDPYRSLELNRLRERVTLVVKALPEREQQIIRLHYFEHLEFQEIGDLMGLSKGRISQLHHRGLRLIRDALGMLRSLNASY